MARKSPGILAWITLGGLGKGLQEPLLPTTSDRHQVRKSRQHLRQADPTRRCQPGQDVFADCCKDVRMLFSQYTFFVYLALVLLGHLATRSSRTANNIVILLASWAFFLYWSLTDF